MCAHDSLGLRGSGSRGYSLVELLVVVSLIGALASIAIPDFSASRAERLDIAASRVAEAIRYARAEALRTGEVHGVTVSQATQRATVMKWDLTSNPASALYTLTDPFSKQPHDFPVDTSATAGVSIANTLDAFDYTGLGRRPSLMFDAGGTPLWIVTSGPSTYLLADGEVLLRLGNYERRVRVAAFSGRVTVQ